LNAGFAVVGNLRMAQTDARMDEYMASMPQRQRPAGRAVHIHDADEVKAKLAAHLRLTILKGALVSPNTDGYINPADVTMDDGKGEAAAARVDDEAQVAGGCVSLEWGMPGKSHATKDGRTCGKPGCLPMEQYRYPAEHVLTGLWQPRRQPDGSDAWDSRCPAIRMEHTLSRDGFRNP